MGMRAAHGDAVAHSRENVARRGGPTDEGRAAGTQRAVRPLRAAQAELQHRVGPRRQAHPRRLRGDETLEVEQVEQVRLQELRLPQGAGHPQDGLAREDHRALRHGVHVADEGGRPVGQTVHERRVEERLSVVAAQAPQVIQFFRAVAPAREQVHRLTQSRRHREPAFERSLAKKQVEDGLVLRQARPPVSAGHGELIQVAEEGARWWQIHGHG